MKSRKKQKKLRITEADFMLANRRAARLEEIAEHGRPVSFRKAVHKSKKVYDRKRLKRMEQKLSDEDYPGRHCVLPGGLTPDGMLHLVLSCFHPVRFSFHTCR